MEGYSVTEAASVLGVPTERVWELLARGVLSGSPEGETGMRVFLQPRPGPAAGESGRQNGDREREEPVRELSPFRELLTEFRNLTERYGQALLALGEARGEVAALRSRVDVLEARMDLRLGSGAAPVASTAWPAASSFEHTVIPTTPPRPQPEEQGTPGDEPRARPTVHAGPEREEAEAQTPARRRRAARHATQSFAEALARADDPSLPELPGSVEAAAAFAALRDDLARGEEPAEGSLPRELPAAEAVPVAEERDAPRPEAAEPALAGQEIREPATPAAPSESADSAAPPPEVSWDPERYTVEIGEPDWYEGEPSASSSTPEREGAGSEDDGSHAGATPAPPTQRPADERAGSPTSSRGDADEMEVAPTGRVPAGSAAGHGSPQLADALAALEALAREASSRPLPAAEHAPQRRTEEPEQAKPRTEGSGRAMGSPAPPTTASRAYRRLRRIFPG